MESDDIEKLQAEVQVLRRYIKAIIGAMPNTQQINAAFNGVHQQIVTDANLLPESQAQALRDANNLIGYHAISKQGLLAKGV